MQAGFPQLFTFLVVLVSFLEGCGDPPRARLVMTVNPGNTTGIGETITAILATSEANGETSVASARRLVDRRLAAAKSD